MFSSVSWHGFGVAVTIVLALYYSVLLAVLYRYDILKILREGLPGRNKAIAGPVTDRQEAREPVLFAGINELLEELEALFKKAAAKQYHREELLQALHSVLKNYRQLKDTPFEEAAGKHIIHAAESLCHIILGEDDIKRLW